MDLLRLVLARQPMVKLVLLPRLLHSRKFLQERRRIYDLPPTDDFRRQAVNHGDLFPDAGRYSDNGMLLIRACFLQSSQIFLNFSPLNRGNLDFWYAIGTGIPAIQNEAIRILSENTNYIGQLDILEDESSIPWTPELRSKLQDMLNYFMHEKKMGSGIIPTGIFGMMDIELPARFYEEKYFSSGSIIAYIHYRVRAILNYKNVYRRFSEVEVVFLKYVPMLIKRKLERYDYIRMGYLAPVIFEFNVDVNVEMKAKGICGAALRLVNYDLLQLMITLGHHIYAQNIQVVIEKRFSISRTQVINARKCLDEPKIRGMMGPGTLLGFRTVAGEMLSPMERNDLNDLVGPGPQILGGEGNQGSIQDIVIYDLRALEGNGIRRYKFARGIAE